MSKRLTRRDRLRRKKKAATRERRYLHAIEEKMIRGNVDFREEMARPTLTGRAIQQQQAATKGVP